MRILTCFLLGCMLQLQVAKSQNATFDVTFSGFSTEQEDAFLYATTLWSQYLISDVPIKIAAHMQLLLPGQLGITFPNGRMNFPDAPVPDVWYATSLANAISGSEQNPGEVDMEIYLSSIANWYLGTDGATPPGQYDLVSTVLHEICHGLGFLSLANYTAPEGSFGLIFAENFAPLTTSFPWPDLDTMPGIFDIFIETFDGTNLLSYSNPSEELGTAFLGGNLFFDGPRVLADNGGERGRLHAPPAYVLGTSVTHWSETYYPVGDPNELMTPGAAAGTSNHLPGPLTLALLDDIGWNIIYDTAQTFIEDLHAEAVEIKPNPVHNVGYIYFHFPVQEGLLTIIDMSGRMMH